MKFKTLINKSFDILLIPFYPLLIAIYWDKIKKSEMKEQNIAANDLKAEINQLELNIKTLVKDFYDKTSFCPLIKIESWFTCNCEKNILTRTNVDITLKSIN